MNNSRVLAILDRVDPFSSPADESPFGEPDLLELAAIPNAEEELVGVARDDGASAARRYAAAEALIEGRLTNWRSSPADSRAVADALATAMLNDTTHNRWGLPGYFAGRLGEQLLSLPEGVVEALTPLLDKSTDLKLEGSEAATLNSAAHYRIADLAAYFLSRYLGLPWESDSSAERRDEAITALRTRLK